MTTLAFDVYGTLIDTQGVSLALEKFLGEQASEFSRAWREKQLEYSFRRGLMQHYENFSVCTRHALEYTCALFHQTFSQTDKDELMDAYQTLPAFEDARSGLEQAKQAGFRLFAFSNGSSDAVEQLLIKADIRDYLMDVVSVDEIRSFKPNPGAYCHFLRRAGTTGDDTWLISSNPFDVIGARSAGLYAAWVKRSPQALFDPWGIEPTLIVPSLLHLPQEILRRSG